MFVNSLTVAGNDREQLFAALSQFLILGRCNAQFVENAEIIFADLLAVIFETSGFVEQPDHSDFLLSHHANDFLSDDSHRGPVAFDHRTHFADDLAFAQFLSDHFVRWQRDVGGDRPDVHFLHDRSFLHVDGGGRWLG